MTFRIEKIVDGQKTALCVSGRIGAQNLEDLRAEMNGKGSATVLDLEHVTLVDLDGIRFLIDCEAQGVELKHCSLYIREWMERERQN